MEKIRTDNNFKESGIALVMALVITLVVLMLISSLTYFFTKGFQTNIINRKFSTVYEAANGGVEYTTGVVNASLQNQALPGDFGSYNVSDTVMLDIVKCTDRSTTATITANTADGNYRITSQIKCLAIKGIPGKGGALRFPPPPSGGGIAESGQNYYFYSIITEAKETSGTEKNIGRTEAIYRAIP